MQRGAIRDMADDIMGDDRKPKGTRALDRIQIEPAESVAGDDGKQRRSGGAVVTAHIREETGDKEMPVRYHERRHVFIRARDAGDHVARLLDEGDLP